MVEALGEVERARDHIGSRLDGSDGQGAHRSKGENQDGPGSDINTPEEQVRQAVQRLFEKSRVDNPQLGELTSKILGNKTHPAPLGDS